MTFDDEEGQVGGGRLNPRDVVNHLLMVWTIEYRANAPSRYNPNGDLVVVDVVDLDQPGDDGQMGLLSRANWWRPGRLIRDLKQRVGRPNPYLAFMTQGTASPGMNSPFELVAAFREPSCVVRGETWLQAHPDFQPSEPYVERPQQQYTQPAAVPYQAPAQQRPTLPPPPDPQRTLLERLALQSRGGADRLPPDSGEAPF